MKLRNSIINNLAFGFWLLAFGFSFSAFAQKVAVITPEKTENTVKTATMLSANLNTLDSDLVANTLHSITYENFYNLSTEEAKNVGNIIGCDFFIVLKSENLRRASLSKPVYFESYAVVYLVSAKTGRLVFWTLKSFEGDAPNVADKQLFDSLPKLENELKDKIKFFYQNEFKEGSPTNLEELPEENSPEAVNFKSPLPFKRQVPLYKRLANLYSVAATVDAMVDLDENGQVTRIEITRWAGYDLDESVIETIKKMNWRPASRNGKTLPIRVLLRYNFKKIEKEE